MSDNKWETFSEGISVIPPFKITEILSFDLQNRNGR